MLFLDELAQEKDIQEVSLRLVEVLYAFLQFESSKSGPKIVKSELTDRGLFKRGLFKIVARNDGQTPG